MTINDITEEILREKNYRSLNEALNHYNKEFVPNFEIYKEVYNFTELPKFEVYLYIVYIPILHPPDSDDKNKTFIYK